MKTIFLATVLALAGCNDSQTHAALRQLGPAVEVCTTYKTGKTDGLPGEWCGKVRIGMTAAEVDIKMGGNNPGLLSRTVTAAGTVERWRYQCRRTGTTTLEFQNGVLAGISTP